MASDRKDLKEKIAQLTKQDLEKIVLKFAIKNSELFNYLLINYFYKDFGETDLFEEAKDDLEIILFYKSHKGYAEQLRLAKKIPACIKRINAFAKVCKDKKLEMDLLMYVLENIFLLPVDLLGKCFTVYDYKVGLVVKRVITLLNTKLHPDYKIEYRERINQYLNILHRTSMHIDFIYALPESI